MAVCREGTSRVQDPAKLTLPGQSARAPLLRSWPTAGREDDEDLSNEDEYYDGGDEPEEMTEIEFEGSVESEE